MRLIKMQAAIDALEKEKPTPFVNKDGSIDPFGAGQQNQWYRDGIAIMNLPTAEPERKKGTWKNGMCSECGYDWNKVAPLASVPDFCPGCGAIMKVKEKGYEE